MVSNRDIGFVDAGQDAAIKVDTFNFTRYGLLHGQVLSVSQDAIIRDRPPERPGDRAPGAQTRQQRAQRPGAELQRPHLARSHADADRRPPGQPVAGHGGDGGDQDRLAHHSELSAIAVAALPARDHAGTLVAIHDRLSFFNGSLLCMGLFSRVLALARGFVELRARLQPLLLRARQRVGGIGACLRQLRGLLGIARENVRQRQRGVDLGDDVADARDLALGFGNPFLQRAAIVRLRRCGFSPCRAALARRGLAAARATAPAGGTRRGRRRNWSRCGRRRSRADRRRLRSDSGRARP